MNIVIDTSAIIAVITNEPQKARLIQQTHGEQVAACLGVEQRGPLLMLMNRLLVDEG